MASQAAEFDAVAYAQRELAPLLKQIIAATAAGIAARMTSDSRGACAGAAPPSSSSACVIAAISPTGRLRRRVYRLFVLEACRALMPSEGWK